MIKIIKQTLTTEFVDDTTGEVFTDKREFTDASVKPAKATKKSSSSKKNPYDDDPEPILVREDNKLILNTAAVNILQASEGDRINIKEQAINRKKRLVIGLSETFGTKEGNLLTKSNTIRWSGKNAETVARYGDEFNFLPHDKTEGLFILVNRNEEADEEVNPDEYIDVESEIEELNSDLSEDTEIVIKGMNFNI